MEGTQRQLGTGLTDTFGGDDTYGHVRFNKSTVGKVASVATLAGATP
jgi:hypothetical protein